MATRCRTRRPDFKRQERVLKALASEARLRMVFRLSQGDCSAGELVEEVELDPSTVSKHLSVLRAQGIVDSQRDGTSVIYRLLTPCVLDFFACADEVCAKRK